MLNSCLKLSVFTAAAVTLFSFAANKSYAKDRMVLPHAQANPAGAENVFDTSQENVDRVFYRALDRAEEYAKSLGADSIAAEGSGELVKSIGRRKIIIFETQNIYVFVSKDGKMQKLKAAAVLPEVEHLRKLYSSEKLFSFMKIGIDRALKK